MQDDERWASTHKRCNGFASHYGPCGDPYCSDCFPGGRVCRDCSLLDGECECDNCKMCGEAWVHDFEGQGYDDCPYCYCENCGDSRDDCECKEFDNGDPKTNDEIRKKKE